MGVIANFENPYGNVIVSFNNVNLRLTNIEWTLDIPSGWGVRTEIWRMDVDPVNPAIIREDYTDGSENVPGNFQVIEMVDEFLGFTYYAMPPDLRFQHTLLRPPP